MTYEQYWEHEPYLVVYYRKAHKLKNSQKNQEMWLQGYYNHEAFSTAIYNSFKKKNDEAITYMKEPVALTQTEIEEREKRDRKRKMLTSKAKFEVWAETLELPTQQNN